jgi:hypothetical protein
MSMGWRTTGAATVPAVGPLAGGGAGRAVAKAAGVETWFPAGAAVDSVAIISSSQQILGECTEKR